MDLNKIENKLGSLTQDSADHLLHLLSGEIKYLASRGLRCMMLLGQVLLEIQDRELWRGRWESWGDFLKTGMPTYAGLSGRTAYDAMLLARSPALNRLPLDQVEAITSVSNAKRIARLERAGEPITSKVIEMSQTLRTEEFHRHTGATAGTKVQVWIQDPAAAQAMQRLVDLLAGATASAIAALVDLLGSDRLVGYAGASKDNRIDAAVGAVVAALTADLDGAESANADSPERLDRATNSINSEMQYEKLLGMEVQVWHGRDQRFVAFAYRNGDESDGHPTAFGSGASIDLALQDLRTANLRHVVMAKIQAQGYRCAVCNRAVELQGHHITFRSQGGNDLPENIEALCAECHYKRHHRRSHPKRAGKFQEQAPQIDCLHERIGVATTLIPGVT